MSSVNWLIMDPSSDKVSYVFSLPLRGHMTYSVNCGEVEAIISSQKAWSLIASCPLSPVFCDIPAKPLNPLSCTISGDTTVCITRVKEDLVTIWLQDSVDPFWGFPLIVVEILESVVTLLPGRESVRNVKSSSYFSSVEVVSHVRSKKRMVHILRDMLSPWSVLFLSHSKFVGLLLSVYFNSSFSIFLRDYYIAVRINLPEEIIPI